MEQKELKAKKFLSATTARFRYKSFNYNARDAAKIRECEFRDLHQHKVFAICETQITYVLASMYLCILCVMSYAKSLHSEIEAELVPTSCSNDDTSHAGKH